MYLLLLCAGVRRQIKPLLSIPVPFIHPLAARAGHLSSAHCAGVHPDHHDGGEGRRCLSHWFALLFGKSVGTWVLVAMVPVEASVYNFDHARNKKKALGCVRYLTHARARAGILRCNRCRPFERELSLSPVPNRTVLQILQVQIATERTPAMSISEIPCLCIVLRCRDVPPACLAACL